MKIETYLSAKRNREKKAKIENFRNLLKFGIETIGNDESGNKAVLEHDHRVTERISKALYEEMKELDEEFEKL